MTRHFVQCVECVPKKFTRFIAATLSDHSVRRPTIYATAMLLVVVPLVNARATNLVRTLCANTTLVDSAKIQLIVLLGMKILSCAGNCKTLKGVTVVSDPVAFQNHLLAM